jgi:hypothetical protein
MAQARGYKATLTMDTETTFGVDPATKAGKRLPINSFDIKPSRTKNQAQTLTGSRNPAEPFDGNVAVSGSVAVPVDAVAFGHWLKALFGAPTTTGTTTKTHTFKIGDTQPSLVLDVNYGASPAVYGKANGCKVSKLSMKVGGDGELVADIGVEGANMTFGSTAYDDAATAVALSSRFGNFQAAVKEGGVTVATVTDFSFEINPGLDTSVYVLNGTGTRGDIPEGIMACSGTLTVLFADTALLTKAQNSTETSLELTFTNGANILKITFPEAQLQFTGPGVSGPAGVRLELPWIAYHGDDAGASAVKVELTNNVTSY